MLWMRLVKVLSSEPDLRTGVAAGIHTGILQRHGQQADGDLFASRNDYIQFTRVGACLHPLASAIRRLVSPLMADTTTTMSCPWISIWRLAWQRS